MEHRRIVTPFVLLALLLGVVLRATAAEGPALRLVPEPRSCEIDRAGVGLTVQRRMVAVVPAEPAIFREHFELVSDLLGSAGICRIVLADDASGEASGASIKVAVRPDLKEEAYRLTIHDDVASIEASGIRGLARATATLCQMLAKGPRVPAVDIQDEPVNSFRNVMLDLGRNPHSVGCLRETIDLLWFYKVDSLQLHLTDDQRFAFPSKAFPQLANTDSAISWDEFKELERYAAVRGVYLIPELDVPGHSGILRRQYPEVFGETTEQLARSAESRKAVKQILAEMIEVFPTSPYVHVGGDEAGGVPEDLQRDFINDLHRFLKSRNKQTIVWEGPRLGEGANKVDTDVIQVNWETTNFPADQMLEAGYRVVNAAWDPLYIVDHYPRNNFTMVAPQRVYEELDLRKFRAVNPRMATYLDSAKTRDSDRLIGFCMPWWEGREANFYKLVPPRVIPMAEVAWSYPDNRDYNEFQSRVDATEAVRAKLFYPVTVEASPLVLERESVFDASTTVKLSASEDGVIRYSLDGSQPTPESAVYREPIKLDRSATVCAALFRDDRPVWHCTRRSFTRVEPESNLALGKPVTASVPSGPVLSAARLTDGGVGNLDYFLAYPTEPEPVAITIDLGEPMPVGRVVLHAFFNGATYESHAVQVSEDGENFTTVAERWERPETPGPSVTHDFDQRTARYVRILTRGLKGYVFDSFSKITEIQVFSEGS